MQSLARNGYTADQVRAALHAERRVEAYRFELLDSKNNQKGWLTNVIGGSVANNTANEIRRTAKFTVREDNSINFLSDRIRPWHRLRMSDGCYAEWPLGVFLLASPKRKAHGKRLVIREIEAYDQLFILTQDKETDRFTVSAGENVIGKVSSILTGAGITAQNLTASAQTMPADRDWDPATPKLTIINDLLKAINYRSLFFDELGVAVAQPYVTPDVRASEYTYADDDQSVMFPDVEQSLDLFQVPNKFVMVVSDADWPVLVSTYTNTNPDSPTSTVSRGITIVDYENNADAVDQVTLDAQCKRRAFEKSQVYDEVPFETAVMPFHSDEDVLTFEFTGLGISAKYTEASWEFDLKAGAPMKHQIRRVVSV